jgi:dolichyl-phosphate beta-glucosyltransferase
VEGSPPFCLENIKPYNILAAIAMSTLQLSIVIPAYNEASRILQTLGSIKLYLEQTGYDSEVIVVNDGSSDSTAEMVTAQALTWSLLRLIHNPGNQGKGFSVKNGALQARGRIVLFTDADLSAPIAELPKLVDPILRSECDLTFGSRAIDRSLIGVHQSVFREYSGRLFNLFVRLITGLPYSDTQCGFKAFWREKSLPVFERQTINRFGFDPEILYIARRRGLRMQEIPVRWNHVEGTTVRFLKDSVRMFLDLARIRWNDLRGKYR